MRFLIDRTTIILVIFLVVIAAIFGLNQAIRQDPLEITIAVDPLAENWIQAAAQEYNASNTLIGNGTIPVQIKIIIEDDLDIWRGNPNWGSSNHPQAWIASSQASINYLPPNLPFRALHQSLARTPLVWGGFENRVFWVRDEDSRSFDWSAVQDISVAQSWQNLGAANESGNINMALNWPANSMAGIGALMTSAADYGQTPILSRELLNEADFTDWFFPISETLYNSRTLGGNPAETMASRGTSAADYALLPEVQWLLSVDDLADDGFVFNYPAYQFVLDFPMARWEDTQTKDDEKAAVASFGEFLAGERGQALALEHGLRPVNSEPDENATLFSNGQAYGIQLTPDYGQIVEAPSRGLVDLVIGLVE